MSGASKLAMSVAFVVLALVMPAVGVKLYKSLLWFFMVSGFSQYDATPFAVILSGVVATIAFTGCVFGAVFVWLFPPNTTERGE